MGILGMARRAKAEEETSNVRKLTGQITKVVFIIGLIYTLFQLWTALVGSYPNVIQRSIHLGFALVLLPILYPILPAKSKYNRMNHVTVFIVGGGAGTILLAIIIEMLTPFVSAQIPPVGWIIGGLILAIIMYLPIRHSLNQNNDQLLAVDVVIAVLVLIVTAYTLQNYERIIYFADAARMDYLIALSLIFIVLEASRRVTGLVLVGLAAISIFYVLAGHLIGGFWGHPQITISAMLGSLYLSVDGMYGNIVDISARVVAIFLIYGALLNRTGLGQSFIDIALAVAGRRKGGCAKVSVISSGLFGVISGSSVANVLVTGNFTIPLMKSVGYPPAFAAGCEATASTGGQLMPPVMGAAAFIMAEMLSVSYLNIMGAGILPALAYYMAVYISVDLLARKGNLPAVPEKSIPTMREAMSIRKIAILGVSIITLIVFLVRGYDLSRAVFWASGVVGLLYLTIERDQGIASRIINVFEGLVDGAKVIVVVASIMGIAQLIVACIGMSGPGIKISLLISSIGENSLLGAMLCAGAIELILGMGLPTVAAYVIGVGIIAPGLINLGVAALNAHFFIFYYAVISSITPPMAAAVFVAAPLARAPWPATAGWAMRLGFVGIILPLLFIYHPAVLIVGHTLKDIFMTTMFVLSGVLMLAVVVHGYLNRPVNIVERTLLGISAFLIFLPGVGSSIIGDIIGIAVILYVWYSGRQSVKSEN